MMFYNVRIKTFPDGHRQYFYSEDAILRDIPDEYKSPKCRKVPVPGQQGRGRLRNNMSRSVQQVYDLARSNDFDWFVTLTLSRKYVDRSDYQACTKLLSQFIRHLRYQGNQYIMVPELHEDGTNYHFHGLVQGDLKLTWAKFDRKKQIDIYNLDGWPYGWSTATAIKDKKRVSTYIAKYLTKKLTVPAGAKSYWASRGLQRPSLEYVEMDEIEFRWSILENARYTKEIVCEYGHYFIAEE